MELIWSASGREVSLADLVPFSAGHFENLLFLGQNRRSVPHSVSVLRVAHVRHQFSQPVWLSRLPGVAE